MIEAGSPDRLGASVVDGGVNFAVHAGPAEAVELCVFDAAGGETRHGLPAQSGGVWHGYLAGAAEGARYGYRVHGPFDPTLGWRANPAKLLIDPYARALAGTFRWAPEVFDHAGIGDDLAIDDGDSAPFVPKAVVTGERPRAAANGRSIAWADTLIYETNVRGYTMLHPAVPAGDRGRFPGMRNGQVLEYLRALGVTSVELMPVFEFIDEPFLAKRGLRNYWGYNTIHFFVPAARYGRGDPRGEFVEMVDAIHDAGLEVILDVAYNHTGESGFDGPTLSFRGLDNLGYYRTAAGNPGQYVNDTGTGNTLDMDSPHVRRLVLDSLRYWAKDMGVDGFRFDLATIMGRSADGFSREHAFFAALADDDCLRDTKLIAEPWDPGPGGYQLGQFPPPWAEWNDRYRDSVRRFWRGDAGEAAEFARRLHGSADLFEPGGRRPQASVNFVTAHDGFTLSDLVSYAARHNQANGEDNEDGHAHNFSDNHGVEGDTDDAGINARRRQQRLNLLATLLFSQGTPMLLAGDELGNTQSGNNNAYAQDNPTGWIDWPALEGDPEFLAAVRGLTALRRDIALLSAASYYHGDETQENGEPCVRWLDPEGNAISGDEWAAVDAFSMLLVGARDDQPKRSAALLFNRALEAVRFTLPGVREEWQIRFVSAASDFRPLSGGRFEVPARSLVCATLNDE